MMQTAGLDASVGGCASDLLAGRDALGTGGGAAPSNEWYWLRLAGMGADVVKHMLAGTALRSCASSGGWVYCPRTV